MGGHLAAAAGGVGFGAHPLQELLHWGHPEGQGEGAVPVVEAEPVRCGAEEIGQRDLDRLVAGARDQEEDLALSEELDLAIVDGARRDHRPVPRQKLVPAWKVGFESVPRSSSRVAMCSLR